MKINKREKRLIFGIVVMLLWSVFMIIRSSNLRKENAVLFEIIGHSIDASSNDLKLIDKMRANAQMTKEDLDYYIENVVIYTDSMLLKLQKLK